MNKQEFVSQRDMLDIVFANRNRAYGAYQLRREYPNNLLKALGMGLLLMALLMLSPKIMAAFAGLVSPEVVEFPSDDDRVFTEVKVIQPPVVKVPPPPQASVAYKPPVVAPDHEVNETPAPDVQTILDDGRDIGAQTVEGPDDTPPTLDPPGNGTAVIELPAPPEDDNPVDPFVVSRMPSFPGGEAEMFRWISQNLDYPEQARESGVSGQVVLQFLVAKDGTIQDIQVVKTPAGGAVLGKEAIRVVQSMPRWTPGEHNGKPVKVKFTLPLRFNLQ
ncbi:MAG: energy transducer TonB [Chitinophagales bacterium]|nr:energy transducer TonB [Chitinophagales bacterium]